MDQYYARNKKNLKLYKVLDEVTNSTNENDGQVMVLYQDLKGKKYVREKSEFLEKFEKVEDE